jgi:hypothetical protein
MTPARACLDGQAAAAGTCVAVEEAKAKIDAIVREAMVKRDLKAVLAGVAVGDQPLLIEAWGESMTGVPATPDMHFRNGSVAIAYIGTLLLQLQDKASPAMPRRWRTFPHRDRGVRDLKRKGIDERQSVERPTQGDRRVSRA